MNLAYIGALFLAAAVLSLGVGLIRAARRMERRHVGELAHFQNRASHYFSEAYFSIREP